MGVKKSAINHALELALLTALLGCNMIWMYLVFWLDFQWVIKMLQLFRPLVHELFNNSQFLLYTLGVSSRELCHPPLPSVCITFYGLMKLVQYGKIFSLLI